MNVIDAIKERRSVRKYLDKEISKDNIMDLIEAASMAPSGNNTQPWKFKILSGDEDIEILKKNQIFKQDFVYTAPVIILCVVDPNAYPVKEFDPNYDDKNDLRAFRDLGIASQNLALRATELGLGTCYVGWLNKPKTRELFDMPDHYLIPYAITVGYADGDGVPATKKDITEILL